MLTSGPISRLRQRLQSDAPELYNSLLRSWEIAQNEWLPAVSPSEGSYNSLPHFTNIEHHVDALLGASAESPAVTLRLSPLEIYLLLASVLFHDFGRVYGDADHAAASARTLPQHFTALGIPTIDLALSLSRIALYHDPLTARDKMGEGTKARKLEQARRTLRQVRIEPFGTARELYVATVLALADHMDGSVRRAVPRYVKADDEVGFKGAFRRLVSGTAYSPATYTIVTALNGFDEVTNDQRGALNFGLYRNFLSKPRGANNSTSARTDGDEIAPEDMETADLECPLYEAVVRICCPSLTDKRPSKMFFKCRRAGRDAVLPAYTIDRKVLTVRGTREEIVVKSLWPADYLVATVLNDLGVNRQFLSSVKDELDEMGLPVDDWFVEFGSEVFDEKGDLVNEQLLTDEFLKRVADEMWQLRCRVLRRGLMSYELLADSLRVENAGLVAVAVRRIAERFRPKEGSDQGKGEPKIVAGTSGWAFGHAAFTLEDLRRAVVRSALLRVHSVS